MPILKGVMGFTRFFVKSDIPVDLQTLGEKLNLFRFRPLHPHGEDNETQGWAPYLAEYDHERALNEKDFLYDQKVILSLRVDTISLPKELLKSMVKKSVAAYVRDHKKYPDKVVRKEIELAESKGLRARVLPKTKIIEAIWCQKSNELRIFSRSTSQVDRFIELFLQTFLLRPSRRDFVLEAQHNKAEVDMLSHVPLYLAKIRIDIQ